MRKFLKASLANSAVTDDLGSKLTSVAENINVTGGQADAVTSYLKNVKENVATAL